MAKLIISNGGNVRTKIIFYQKMTAIEAKSSHTCLRALAIVVLNSYIVIFSTTKTQNVFYNSEAKTIFFGSTATMRRYFWLCTVADRYFCFIFLFYVHTIFLIFYSFFCILFYVHTTFPISVSLCSDSFCQWFILRSRYFSSLCVFVQWLKYYFIGCVLVFKWNIILL